MGWAARPSARRAVICVLDGGASNSAMPRVIVVGGYAVSSSDSPVAPDRSSARTVRLVAPTANRASVSATTTGHSDVRTAPVRRGFIDRLLHWIADTLLA